MKILHILLSLCFVSIAYGDIIEGDPETISTVTTTSLQGNSHVRLVENQPGTFVFAIWENVNLDANLALASKQVQAIHADVRRGDVWSDTFVLGNGVTPQVATQQVTSGGGIAIAVWSYRPTNSFTSTIFASKFTPAADAADIGTWSDPVVVATGSNLIHPQIAMDSAGNAVAVWTSNVVSFDTSPQIFASEYNITTDTWSTPVILTLSGTFPSVSMSAAGVATVAWQTVVDGAQTDIITVQVTRS